MTVISLSSILTTVLNLTIKKSCDILKV